MLKLLISIWLLLSITCSASASPIAAECLNPWPEQGDANHDAIVVRVNVDDEIRIGRCRIQTTCCGSASIGNSRVSGIGASPLLAFKRQECGRSFPV
jgi:hypothetical protein